jgi:hypothetical protein
MIHIFKIVEEEDILCRHSNLLEPSECLDIGHLYQLLAESKQNCSDDHLVSVAVKTVIRTLGLSHAFCIILALSLLKTRFEAFVWLWGHLETLNNE